MIEVKWHGRGGQGSFTIARILGLAASVYGGMYSQAFPSFGPERRGAPVLGFTRIAQEKITDRSEPDNCDYIVVLDETLWGPGITEGLKPESIIIINTSTPEKYEKEIKNKIISIDATSLALEVLKLPITNTAMMGALIGASEIVGIEDCKSAIESSMNKKVSGKNKELFQRAYEMVKGADCHE